MYDLKQVFSLELSVSRGTAGLGVCCFVWSLMGNKMGARGMGEIREGGKDGRFQLKSLYLTIR